MTWGLRYRLGQVWKKFCTALGLAEEEIEILSQGEMEELIEEASGGESLEEQTTLPIFEDTQELPRIVLNAVQGAGSQQHQSYAEWAKPEDISLLDIASAPYATRRQLSTNLYNRRNAARGWKPEAGETNHAFYELIRQMEAASVMREVPKAKPRIELGGIVREQSISFGERIINERCRYCGSHEIIATSMVERECPECNTFYSLAPEAAQI